MHVQQFHLYKLFQFRKSLKILNSVIEPPLPSVKVHKFPVTNPSTSIKLQL